MFAGTVVCVHAGSSVPNLQTLADNGINAVFTPSELTQIVVAFVLLGAFPLIVRYLMKLFTQLGLAIRLRLKCHFLVRFR